MFGVAAITLVAYVLTTYIDVSESPELGVQSKMSVKNFERFGEEYFLTEFNSKRSFGSVSYGKMPRNKKNARRRRRSKEGSYISSSV